jgi:hypothetical protein
MFLFISFLSPLSLLEKGWISSFFSSNFLFSKEREREREKRLSIYLFFQPFSPLKWVDILFNLLQPLSWHIWNE